jgi:hypothetical protein
MAATVVYTQGRGSVTVDCADGWRRMVPERHVRQLAIVRMRNRVGRYERRDR